MPRGPQQFAVVAERVASSRSGAAHAQFRSNPQSSFPDAKAVALPKENPYHKEIPYIIRTRHIMITSKLTTKAQTTIPQPVRTALHLQAGDELIYEIDDQRVILRKASRGGKPDDPFRTFSEWNSEADTKAYGNSLRHARSTSRASSQSCRARPTGKRTRLTG
jgi:antitoxin PrlF